MQDHPANNPKTQNGYMHSGPAYNQKWLYAGQSCIPYMHFGVFHYLQGPRCTAMHCNVLVRLDDIGCVPMLSAFSKRCKRTKFTNYYCHQIASNPYTHHPSQITIVISSSMQKTGFQTVKFLQAY